MMASDGDYQLMKQVIAFTDYYRVDLQNKSCYDSAVMATLRPTHVGHMSISENIDGPESAFTLTLPPRGPPESRSFCPLSKLHFP